MCFYRLKKLALTENLKVSHAFGTAIKNLYANRVAIARRDRESVNYNNEPFKKRF